MYGRLLFFVREKELEGGKHMLAIVIERQISYFADSEAFSAFLKLIKESQLLPAFEAAADVFVKDKPRTPFSIWTDVDKDFQNLVCAMTSFDPTKRITAREALGHKWFEDA